MDVVETYGQKPCEWCLDVRPSLLLCRCETDCGELDCPNNPALAEARPDVPRFFLDLAAFVATPAAQIDADVVRMSPNHYGLAIARVAEMHKKCVCKVCLAGTSRPTCIGCSDFWPCKTVHALRGTLQTLV